MNGPIDLTLLVAGHTSDDDATSLGVARNALASGRPMWPRTEFQPGHFTASGFVASSDGSKLLLIEHARLGRWLQPGGHIEVADPTVEAAARREVGEETGIHDLERLGTGLLRIDAHPIPPRGNEPAHTHIDLGIGFRSRTDQIGNLDEVLDAAWVPFAGLGDYGADDAVRLGARRLQELL